MKSFIFNTALVFLTIIFTLLFLEFIVFRFMFIASDIPENYFDGNSSLIKLLPNQKGIFREKNEVQTYFNINNNGWNSVYDKYNVNKNNKKRVAIIGDSYVEALMVDYNNSMAEQLERKLGINYEVYRFAISGAPLSQYLYMLKKEVLSFHPDIVIFVLVHNDFDESWGFKLGRYTSSFMKFKINNGKVVEEIEPKKYEKRWYEFVRQSALYRYLVYRQKTNITALKKKILNNNIDDKKYEANVDITNLEEKMINNKISVDYFIEQISKLSKKYNFNPIIMIDGDRGSIYNKKKLNKENSIFQINNYIKIKCEQNSIKFIDLTNPFKIDYIRYGIKFNYECDGHWNTYGHKIASDEVYKLINE